MYLKNEENYINSIPPQLDVEDIKNIKVFDVEPEEIRTFPLVVLTGSNGKIVTTGIGDMAMEVRDKSNGNLTAYRYGGIYDFNLVLEIVTKSTFEREFLSDLITRALRIALRRPMQADGVLIKNISYGGETSGNYDSTHIYLSSLNLSTWSEWYEDFELLPNGGIDIDYNKKFKN